MGRVTPVDRNRVITICGMHRSHTSFLASWLHSCGLDMGERLMPPGPGNPLGFYEDMDFLELHERLLSENKTTALGPDIDTLTIAEGLRSDAKSLVSHKNDSNEQWGWKDPRTALIFRDLWHDLIPDAFVIVIYRHYSEVVQSCYDREIELAHLAWKSTYRRHRENNIVSEPIAQLKEKADLIRKKITPPYTKEELLMTWNTYNLKCLQMQEYIPHGNILFIRLEELLQHHNLICHHLTKQWKLNIHYSDAREMWNEGKPKRRENLDQLDTKTSEIIFESLNTLNAFI